MKKRYFDATTLALWILIVLVIIMVVTIVTLNVFLQDESAIKSLLLDLLNALLSAVTVGVIATMFTQIITQNIAKVKRNNDKLAEFGVKYIGTGISSKKDKRQLFGNSHIKKYPAEIKLLFISGNGFFKYFQNDLLNCLQSSNCSVKVLLLSTDPSNQAYIKRMEKLCPQETPYIQQVNDEAIPILQAIIDQLDEKKKKQIQLRFYKDEYRYNYRIAKYSTGESVYGKCWLNIQPFNRDAVDVSVGLNGEWDDEASSENNIFELLDTGFDCLWNEYEDTAYKFE